MQQFRRRLLNIYSDYFSDDERRRLVLRKHEATPWDYLIPTALTGVVVMTSVVVLNLRW
jgi:hypothetical protein